MALGGPVTIVGSSFSLHFPRQASIRRKAGEFEDELGEFFAPPQVIPIPDDVNEQFPRMILTSKRGHSLVEVTQGSLTMRTGYDGDFASDFSKCRAYVQARADKLRSLVSGLASGMIHFCGLVVDLQVSSPDDNEAVQFLSSLLNPRVLPLGIDSLGQRLTFVRDPYYVNITLSNYRQYSGNAPADRIVPAYLSRVSSGVAIQLDVNDRYAFNEQRDYSSGATVPAELLDRAQGLLTGSLPALLERGEVNLP